MPQQLATNLTRVVGDGAAAKDIVLGSARINGIVVTKTTANAEIVNFTDATTTTPILTIVVPGESTVTFETMWLAENGLRLALAATSAIIVTVAHGAVGA